MAEILEIKIFLAVDDFLYLPLYLAKEYGLFEDLKDIKVELIHPLSGEGDIDAVKKMLRENESNASTIGLAVADPTSFLSNNWGGSNSSYECCRIIGSLITKCPFWGASNEAKTYDNLNKIAKDFDKVIYYNQQLITGNHLGVELKNRHSTVTGFPTVPGNEITEFNSQSSSKCIVITTDIISIVKNNLEINIKYSSIKPNFLTTSLITSKDKLTDKNKSSKEGLTKVIKAIQQAVLIFYSSKRMAILTAKNISPKVQSYNPHLSGIDLNDSDYLKIIEIIHAERIYSVDFESSIENWSNAINTRSSMELSSDVINPNSTFNDYFDHSVVEDIKLRQAHDLGISIRTFKNKIIPFLLKGIRRVFRDIGQILAYNISGILFITLTIIFLLLIGALIFFKFQGPENKKIYDIIMFIFQIYSIIYGVIASVYITAYFANKSNKK